MRALGDEASAGCELIQLRRLRVLAASSDDRVSCGCGDKCGSIERALQRVDCESGERTQLPSQRPSGAAHQRG
jgi:hypothetical protein